MRMPRTFLLVVSLGIVLLIMSSLIAQDPEERLWFQRWIALSHASDADTISWDEILEAQLLLGSAVSNWSNQTVQNPALELSTEYPVTAFDDEYYVEGTEYRWEFPDIEHDGGRSYGLELGSAPNLTLTPGLNLSRSVTPKQLNYPGGQQEVTVTIELKEPLDYISFSSWGVHDLPYQSGPISFSASSTWVECHTDPYWYVYCVEYWPVVGEIYTVTMTYDVQLEDPVTTIVHVPQAGIWTRSYDQPQITSYGNSICLPSEVGDWTWTFDSYHNLQAQLFRTKSVGFRHYASWSMDVEIDIKPGSYPNSINLGSKGAIPVAVISTPIFDATTVDPVTVTLAGAAVRLKGKGTPMASFEDLNLDGLLDLVVHVSTEALELTETDIDAVLEGETFNGNSIWGTDSIRVVP